MPLLDLTRDLRAAARLGTTPAAVNELLGDAMEAFGRLVPFDLATIMELEGDELWVRVARGSLAGGEVQQHRLQLPSFPAIRQVLADGRARAFDQHDHSEGDGDPFDGVLDLPHGHCCMVVPLSARGEPLGVMTLDRQVCGGYGDDVVGLADVFGKLLALAMSYGEQSEILLRVRDQLAEQNRLLSQEVRGRHRPTEMIEAMTSPAMQHVASLARQVAVTDAPVLIVGETGSGKEVLAGALHGWSHRSDAPFIAVNCAALPAGLIESELFGHKKGAFSGASSNRIGRFQAANGGTLFLDEIGELPLEMQAKLLRALQDGTFEPVGSDRMVRVDVRIIAATNVEVQRAIEEQRLREDLYYRLAVFPIQLPPLRARREDVETIARAHLEALAQRGRRAPWRLEPAVLDNLVARPWRGNVRELLNVLDRAAILSPGAELRLTEPAPAPREAAASAPAREHIATLAQIERQHIERALSEVGGRVHGAGGAAELLDLNPSTLRSRMRKLGIVSGRSRVQRATGAKEDSSNSRSARQREISDAGPSTLK